MSLYEGVHEFLRRRENGIRRDQGHHHLLRAAGSAHLDIAKKARPSILVVDTDLEGLREIKDRLDDPVSPQILEQAGLDRHHFVGARFVNAAYRLSLFVRGKNARHLVSVVVGVLHADDRVHSAEFPDQLLHQLLLALRLFGVRNVDHGAAAALFGHGASGFFAVCTVFCRFIS